MSTTTEQNKAIAAQDKSIAAQNKSIVQRFNKECVEEGNMRSFSELLAADCINHAAPPGGDKGPAGMIHFLNDILRTAFPDLKVVILDQVAEGDKVVSRKEIRGTHAGVFMGIAATHKKVLIKVIDIIRVQDGKYAEHWGMSNIPEIIAELSA